MSPLGLIGGTFRGARGTGMAAALFSIMALLPLAAPNQCRAEDGVRSASAFLSDALKAEQNDLALNRGSLWLDEGAVQWATPPAPATAGRSPATTPPRSCASCHGALMPAMTGVATRYPAIDRTSGRLMNLEMRINQCATSHQSLPALAYESDVLLALTAAIAVQSRGQSVAVSTEGLAAPHFEAGRRFFNERQGQLNLACSQCHVDNVGRSLRGDTISSGLPTGYPAYRLEWNGLGSLHRRLRACQIGVRAEDLKAGSPEHLALELYLAWRARGEPVETPAIRR